ncbi:MAG: hypothetical protein ACJ761_11190, partial [Chloroflexota bacterium]
MATAWLLLVTITVVPVRDPGRVSFWAVVVVAFAAYAALCGAYLAIGRRSPLVRGAVAAASVAAIGVGAFFIVDVLFRSREFEGYILLMGAILAGQGAAILAHVAASRRGRQEGRT